MQHRIGNVRNRTSKWVPITLQGSKVRSRAQGETEERPHCREEGGQVACSPGAWVTAGKGQLNSAEAQWLLVTSESSLEKFSSKWSDGHSRPQWLLRYLGSDVPRKGQEATVIWERSQLNSELCSCGLALCDGSKWQDLCLQEAQLSSSQQVRH